ncbi:MAG: CapA family protein [Bacteroidales bacterium]|nr:CapA family protein [Bacteroidales bacterium]
MNRLILYLSFIACFATTSHINAQTISLLFAGDAMQHEAQLKDAVNSNGSFFYDNNFELIKDEITSADIAVVNFETTLGNPPYRGYPTFCSPDEFAIALKDCGFDIFLTANNHCLDKGSNGVFRTINVLDSLNIKHLGTYKSDYERNIKYPMIIRKGDVKIGMLNYTYGTNGITAKQGAVVDYIDTTLIKRDIAFCNIKGADIIIANVHWGDEYQLNQNIHQKRLADWLHKNGVRIIIGSHPHVIQPIESVTDSCGNIKYLTVYSLGNFISNMRTKMTKGAIIFRLNLVKENDSIKIVNPRYAKIFTQRPDIVKNEPYKILPCDSIYINNCVATPKLKEEMLIFNKETDRVFKKHNKGEINEYFFSKNALDSCINEK